MERGYWTVSQRIKPDATPIDNITKFAWYDDDYIEEEVWVEYSDEEWRRLRSEELQKSLDDTDWYASRLLESFLLCKTEEEVAAWREESSEKFGNMIAQREEWREELNSLNNEAENG